MKRVIHIGSALALAISLILGASSTVRGAEDRARALPPNTWVNMHATGVAEGKGVGDEGYSTFVYSPGLGKGLVFGQYHAVDVASGEDQNALLAYDFAQNRWDILEVTEDAWSEFLPGVGHDQGNVTIDTVHDLYISHGNMTLHGGTRYQTYVFDLKAGRGKRMMPAREPDIDDLVATAFSPDHGLVLMTHGPSWLYDPLENVWAEVPRSPSPRPGPALVYDAKYRVFVMFGGGGTDETWIFNPSTRTWTKRAPAVSPPARSVPNFAYDSEHGLTLLVGGRGKGWTPLLDMWTYDAGSDRWTRLPVDAPPNSLTTAGNNLIYDSDHRILLLKDTINLRDVWAFRYAPSAGSAQSAAVAASKDLPDPTSNPIPLPLKTWVAIPVPSPFDGGAKHVTVAFNPDDGRLYFEGGDYRGESYRDMDSYRQETYSLSLAERWVDKGNPQAGLRLEHPYCGTGGVQPKHPNFVGWQWDSRRRLFWMIPGEMQFGIQNCPGETEAHADDPGFKLSRIMTFDPTAKTWADIGPAEPPDDDQWASIYDPQSDRIFRFGPAGRVGIYNIAKATWTSQRLSAGEWIYKGLLATDFQARVIYTIDPFKGHLYGYHMDRGNMEDLGAIPGGPLTDAWKQPAIVWDSVNQVLLFSRHPSNLSALTDGDFEAYDPRAKTWERLSTATDIPGVIAHGLIIAFEPRQNAVVLIPRFPSGNPPQFYMYLYRYGSGPHARPSPQSSSRILMKSPWLSRSWMPSESRWWN